MLNKGEYQPNTIEGIALIRHEITHNFQARKYGDARFGVFYLGDSAVQWVRVRDAYLGNRFEKEAYYACVGQQWKIFNENLAKIEKAAHERYEKDGLPWPLEVLMNMGATGNQRID